ALRGAGADPERCTERPEVAGLCLAERRALRLVEQRWLFAVGGDARPDLRPEPVRGGPSELLDAAVVPAPSPSLAQLACVERERQEHSADAGTRDLDDEQRTQ